MEEPTEVEDLTKEQKLEIAKKKFADLKKKNKKKKSKKKDGEQTPEVEGDVEPEEPCAETQPVEDSKSDVNEPADETEPIETKEESETKKEPDTNDKPDTNDEPQPSETVNTIEPETETNEIIDTANLAETETKSKYTPKEQPQSESNNDAAPSIEELQVKITNQERTIKKLRDENTDLKLSKMDLQDRISALEEQVKQLELNGSTHTGAPPAGAPPQPVQPPKLPAAKPVYTRNDFASESKQDLTQFVTKGDFRESLMLWKGWQVDMTQWNSSFGSQQLNL
jgi:uncharacterized coiled-coil protein SlyX